MTESHCLAYCLGSVFKQDQKQKTTVSFKQLMYFLLVVMNQKYQKVFGGEKAIKKRFLVSLSFRDLRWEVPRINKEPCQTEQSPVILRPEEPCAAESAGSHTGDVG